MDTDRFAPDEVARAELRARYGLGERPVVVCVSRLVPRKGQDMLIRALPAIRAARATAPRWSSSAAARTGRAASARARSSGSPITWSSPAACRGDELPAHHALADVFAMPCRTRGAGLDVEGLGIVYPGGVGDRRARRRRSTPVARRKRCCDGETGLVVDGWDVGAIAAPVGDLLADPDRGGRDGRGGPAWVVDELAVGRPGATAARRDC